MNHRNRNRETYNPEERGIALLVALFAVTILSLIGLALMVGSSTEVLIATNFKNSRAIYFAAEAGTEEARYRLGAAAGPNAITPPSDTSTAIYIRANASIDPTSGSAATNIYYDPEYYNITKRDSSGNLTTASSGLTAVQFFNTIQGPTNQVPYAWVKITQKTETLGGQNVDTSSSNNSDAVYYGTNTGSGEISQYVRDAPNSLNHGGNPVYLVTALAVERNGTQRKIQTEVTPPPAEPISAAVDSYENVSFGGNLYIDGQDECYGNTGGVIGVKSAGTVDTPYVTQNINGNPMPISSGTPWRHNVPALIKTLRNSNSFLPIDSTGTNVSCSGNPVTCSGSNVSLGTSPNALGYYFSPGDLDISANSSTGAGILLVNGNLTLHGGFSFAGLIICHGTVNFVGGDSDIVNIHGAIIADHSLNDTTSDLGGTVNIHYNSCEIANAYGKLPLIMLAFKDRALY